MGRVGKRVLVLATTTGYQIRSFGEAADALGVRLVFASDRCDQLDDPWWDRAIPVRFHDLAQSVDAIVSSAGPEIGGIIAVGDRPTELAALVAGRLHLPGNPPAAAAASRNKLLTREALRRGGLNVPAFQILPIVDAAEGPPHDLSYPLVVKPLALSGSRGVIRVNDQPEFEAAMVRLRQLLQAPDVRAERDTPNDQVLVETFIPGREFAVEGLLTAGAFRALAVFDKPDPLDGPFFEETIYVTPSRAPAATQAAIVDAIARAAAAIGLRHGPVHAECRVNDAGVWVLEVAARPIGGLCSKALRFAGGVPLEAVLLRHALGEDVSGVDREPDASAVMMIPIPRRGVYKGVEGVEAARAVAGVDDLRVTAKIDTVVVPLPEGRSYLGFIFAHAADAAAAERAVREAHGRLRFAIERELPVI
jgi:biotin carboxylase